MGLYPHFRDQETHGKNVARSNPGRLVPRRSLLALMLTVPGAAHSQPALTAPVIQPRTGADLPAPFRPTNCKGRQDGFVYWAARREVFRFKYDPAWPQYPRAPLHGAQGQPVIGFDSIPAAPRPTHPEGCRGNPLRGAEAPYMQEHAAQLFSQLSGRSYNTLTPNAWAHGYYAMEHRMVGQSYSETMAGVFHASKRCRIRASGILECLAGAGGDFDDYRINRMLRIARAVLNAEDALPGDLYLSVQFDVQRPTILSGIDVFRSVRVLDNFDIRPEEIDLLIPYFRGLIEYLRKARIPSYRWPASTK
jgi:hypothetical protein